MNRFKTCEDVFLFTYCVISRRGTHDFKALKLFTYSYSYSGCVQNGDFLSKTWIFLKVLLITFNLHRIKCKHNYILRLVVTYCIVDVFYPLISPYSHVKRLYLKVFFCCFIIKITMLPAIPDYYSLL